MFFVANRSRLDQALEQIKGTWNISLLTQPARSPDLNHLDLSFFCALQTDQWKKKQAGNVDKLIAQVEEAYNEFDPWANSNSLMYH
jgi:hypothetical protein